MNEYYVKEDLVLPKALFNQEYKSLNNNDRCIYAILYSCLKFKSSCVGVDELEKFYVNYSQEKLAEYTLLSRRTVATCLKKLCDINLITIKRVGNNKPCRIYISYI